MGQICVWGFSAVCGQNTPPLNLISAIAHLKFRHRHAYFSFFPGEGTYPKRTSLEWLAMKIAGLVSKGATTEECVELLGVPLEHSSAHGKLVLVDKLIEADADGRAGWRGCGGRTLLHVSAVCGNEGVLSSSLTAEAEPDVNRLTPTPSSMSALYLAVEHGHDAIGRRLIIAGADNFKHPESGLTSLHRAISAGHERFAEELITGGADITTRTSGGHTPLHSAVEEGLEGVVSLLTEGLGNNAATSDGDTALTLACRAVEPNKLAIVETLLDARVDVSIRGDGDSALDHASRGGCIPIMQALFRRGCGRARS